ncbi:rCG54088 [Rattus norvegicus]|uniref:RCG54088 n=1 Tax=Rattus norvegicus TaxID=10116 RepID=A6JAU7_RAT|nr:rCG54088 [Rattus norvegicus]
MDSRYYKQTRTGASRPRRLPETAPPQGTPTLRTVSCAPGTGCRGSAR